MIWSTFYLAAAFVAQTMIHEAGHYFFGRMVGYQLLVYRIFAFTIVKNEGSYKMKYYRNQGSLGQCLMLPPNKEPCPFILPTIGGVVLNTLTAVTAMLLLWISWEYINFVHCIGISLFVFYGVGFAVMNIIPDREGYNDGAVLVSLKKDALARTCSQIQMELVQDLMKGKTYGEMDVVKLRIPDGSNLANPLIGYHKIMECYHYMDNRQWEKASRCLSQFYPVMGSVPTKLKNIVLAEQIFIRIMQKDTLMADEMMLKSLEEYFKCGSGDMNYIRVCSAYEIIYKKMNKEKILHNIEKKKENYIYRGEAALCESLIREL
jgi:hypothetical protein